MNGEIVLLTHEEGGLRFELITPTGPEPAAVLSGQLEVAQGVPFVRVTRADGTSQTEAIEAASAAAATPAVAADEALPEDDGAAETAD